MTTNEEKPKGGLSKIVKVVKSESKMRLTRERKLLVIMLALYYPLAFQYRDYSDYIFGLYFFIIICYQIKIEIFK